MHTSNWLTSFVLLLPHDLSFNFLGTLQIGGVSSTTLRNLTASSVLQIHTLYSDCVCVVGFILLSAGLANIRAKAMARQRQREQEGTVDSESGGGGSGRGESGGGGSGSGESGEGGSVSGESGEGGSVSGESGGGGGVDGESGGDGSVRGESGGGGSGESGGGGGVDGESGGGGGVDGESGEGGSVSGESDDSGKEAKECTLVTIGNSEQEPHPQDVANVGIFSSSTNAVNTNTSIAATTTLLVDSSSTHHDTSATTSSTTCIHPGGQQGFITELAEADRVSEDVKNGGEWAVAVSPDRVESRKQQQQQQQQVDIEDLEEEDDVGTLQPTTCTTTGPSYVFEKLSDVPAVRDPGEIEAADRALETLANKPPHQLSTAERVWELAARGGSTREDESVSLDRESQDKIRETLRKNKLTDKTTLAF